MCSPLKFTLVLVLQLNAEMVQPQGCLQFAEERGVIPFENLTSLPSLILSSGSQAIITSYQFQCHGNITAWQTYVEPYGGSHRDGVYSIQFQVWRPSPTVESLGTGCYNKVGYDSYDNIQLIDGEYGLVNRTLEPSAFISVQPGDVTGLLTFSSTGNGNNEGIPLRLEENFGQAAVWYHTGTNQNPIISGPSSCQFLVGPNGLLSSFTRAVPILSVNIAPSSSHQILATSTTTVISPSLVPTTTPNPLPTSQKSTTTTTTTTTTGATNGMDMLIVRANSTGGLKIWIIGAIAGACGLVVLMVILLILVACLVIVRRSTAGIGALTPTKNIEMKENDAYSTRSISNIKYNTNACYATIS